MPGKRRFRSKKRGAPDSEAPRSLSTFTALVLPPLQEGLAQLTVQERYAIQWDLLRACGRALADILASAETFRIVLVQHRHHALVVLDLTLRQQAQVSDLGRSEQHRRTIRAGRHASAATDADSGLESAIRVGLGNRHRVRLGSGTRIDRDITTGLDNVIQSLTADHQVAQNRESPRTVRLYRNRVAVLESTHVQLAGRGAVLVRAVGHAVDDDTAHPADTLTAVRIEGNWFLTLSEQLLVEDIQHFQEGSVLGYVGKVIFMERALVGRALLTPNS